MQKYEAMFFNDKEALQKLIIELIGKCYEENEEAEKQLAEIKEQVDYSYEINTSAEFTLDYTICEGNAEFTDVKDFRDFKAKEDDKFVCAYELDKWCQFEIPEI